MPVMAWLVLVPVEREKNRKREERRMDDGEKA